MSHADGVQKTLTLELLASGDRLSGRVSCEQGQVREFSGRIGLMRAIDDLLEDEGLGPDQSEEAGSPRA